MADEVKFAPLDFDAQECAFQNDQDSGDHTVMCMLRKDGLHCHPSKCFLRQIAHLLLKIRDLLILSRG